MNLAFLEKLDEMVESVARVRLAVRTGCNPEWIEGRELREEKDEVAVEWAERLALILEGKT